MPGRPSDLYYMETALQHAEREATPHPVPLPQGERERCYDYLRNVLKRCFWASANSRNNRGELPLPSWERVGVRGQQLRSFQKIAQVQP